ncbi:MAG: hypothetical protein QOK47_113 [Actinomycetota bacterium]|nr:hypothetical protein [Actinomycetota bacterium]
MSHPSQQGDETPENGKSLGNSNAHPYAGSVAGQIFQTRQKFDPPGKVRTFGVVVPVAPDPTGRSKQQALENRPPVAPKGSAHGKVATLSLGDGRPEVACFQLADLGPEAELVACGNTTAAAAALLAGSDENQRLSMLMRLPGPAVASVRADIRHEIDGTRAVSQTWGGIPFSVSSSTLLAGRRHALCVGALNDYLIVHLRPTESIDDFQLSEAMGLWKTFGFGRRRLSSRLAIVQREDGSSRVRFFTCGDREHPSAPLTGLGVLSLAANELDWLPFRGGREVTTPAGPMVLPRARLSPDGLAALAFAPVIVDLPDLNANVMRKVAA